jgi:hypothetical protein
MLILLAPNAQNASISLNNTYFVFQYNPEKLVHTFNHALPTALGDNIADPQGSLIELFNLTFDLDSVDIDPPTQNQGSASFGLHPALALLELMMQPQSTENQTTLPIVVFKWGEKRSVATRIVSMNVEEKSFDITLNPTRASASLCLRVLDSNEIKSNQDANNICLKHKNTRIALVDVYRMQTGQESTLAASSNSAASASTAATLSVRQSNKRA